MLHLIPPSLHRLLYRVAHGVRSRWLNLVGGRVMGVSIVARDKDGRVLMVRHSYGRHTWEFPGGGIGHQEDAETAARREFAEELGCELKSLVFLGEVEEPFHGAINVVKVFSAVLDGRPRVDGRELIEVRFFAPGELPALSDNARRRLALAGI